MNSLFSIHGIVLCHCGGQLISNSGKVLATAVQNTLSCWQCYTQYGIDYAYRKREDNQTIQLSKNDQIKSLIFAIIQKWSSDGTCDFDGRWYGYPKLKEGVSNLLKEPITMNKVKTLTKDLKKDGLIVFETTYLEEGIIGGKGYFTRRES